ncbi:MAG: hypothetical protein JNM80_02665 [Phycisphaerae bacterium]|nr:hypothetical protein [Phycisphaerae bacterium]
MTAPAPTSPTTPGPVLPGEIVPPLRPPEGGLRREMDRMVRAPVSAARPVLVVGGWRAPALAARGLASRLARLVGGGEFAGCGIAPCWSLESAGDRVRTAARARWGETPIDIVAVSMGGLAARLAAIQGLAIARLFTLGTPHRGARLARWFPVDAAVRAMRPGSALLARLDEGLSGAGYELVCYARLRDSWVGARNCAPPGWPLIWKPGPIVLAHQTISLDGLIAVDIARRVRGEPPLAGAPSEPPSD